ncbi:hypothetical protein DOY81_011636, partial [Sarcophaga bullata]
MEKPLQQPVGKVSQIANLFQRKPIEIQPVEQLSAAAAAAAACAAAAAANASTGTPVTVVRTESHSARFNNARALFEKLGVESNSNLSVKRSGSREDNLCDLQNHSIVHRHVSIPDRSVSPPKRRSPFPSGCQVAASMANNNCNQLNGGPALANSKFIMEPSPKFQHNISRLKSEESISSTTAVSGVSALLSVDKPEKPERKFNSRELIEKQKKWTSHFTKTKTTRSHSDLNRCDIIRTGPGTVLIPSSVIQKKETVTNIITSPLSNHKVSNQMETRSPILASLASHEQDKPPSPPVRHSVQPPEIKPRSSNKIGSPVKSPPLPPIPAVKPKNISPIKLNPERVRSPTKISEPPPPPPAKSAAAAAAQQRSIDEQNGIIAPPPIPPEKPRKKSIDLVESDERHTPVSPTKQSYVYAAKRASIDSLGTSTSTASGNGLLSGSSNSAASPAASASSGPSSPVHTEDEKQENESTEKSEMQQQYYHSMPRRRKSENEG